MGKKIGVTKEEQTLSYFKFYERDLAPIPEKKIAIRDGQPARQSVSFDDKNLFLKGEDENFCQLGYGVNPDGTGFVCNETYMPGVTVEMLDWWFPWHSVGSDLRYKIWDPEDHWFAKADKVDYVIDPAVPNREKTWGVTHMIMEDAGNGPDALALQFMRPADFGYDESIIGTDKCASLVCAVGKSEVAAAMTHKWYPYQDGVMFCSRFWIGYGLAEGKPVRTLPEGAAVPHFVPQGLFGHNIKEFTNLAAILPEVYAENKDNF